MIIYSSTKKGFSDDVIGGEVEKIIGLSFVREMGHSTSPAEIRSWSNSMKDMSLVLNDSEIPDDIGVAIEYKIPQTSKRIDLILTGLTENNTKSAIIVELKQWEKSEITPMDGIVKTFVGGGNREVNHPSYQVWSYAMLLSDFNSSVEEVPINLWPCAFLHNYEPDNVIANDFYKEYVDRAPVFLKPDKLHLRSFIKRYLAHGDHGEILYLIEKGKIRPSKALADCLESMLNDNPEFIMIDDQKLVYESALKLSRESSENNKNVLIVTGGPGTGKSVVAINLLTKLTKEVKLSHYVTKNSAPREVYQLKLSGKMTKSRIASLFCSSGSFYDVASNYFDALIVDEAHRLVRKSGLYSNQGENQIKELINASKFNVFFIDEDQRVTLKDIGTVGEIEKWAKSLGAKTHRLELASQFRCNGSDGYLSWIDNLLQIRTTANESLDGINYDFKVFDNPKLLHEAIIAQNKFDGKSRILAGYCWKWISKKNSILKDIVIGDYAATWNLTTHGQSWIIHPESVSEVGCIHTCQGLDLGYAGVIIGADLIVRNGKIVTDAAKRAGEDKSMFGYKKMFLENPEKAKVIADMIIKNTYRTLLTRGMKGCYVYSVDTETQEYLKFCLAHGIEQPFSID